MTPEIVVVGSCMIDFTSYSKSLPKPGETLHGTKFVTNFGGKGANQCVASAKLGACTALVAKVGEDEWGEKYINSLKNYGIDTKYVSKVQNQSSGIAQINVAENGNNQIVIIAGANNHLLPKDVDDATEYIKNAKVLILQLETSPDVAKAALKLCQGVTVLNGAPYVPDMDLNILKLPTIFCVNEIEASEFAGVAINDQKDAIEAAHVLLDKGCKNVLITLGSQGALYLNGETKDLLTIPAPSVECIDSTGAGDAFIGALGFFLLKNEISMADKIDKACKIASDSTRRQGSQISFPEKSILKEL